MWKFKDTQAVLQISLVVGSSFKFEVTENSILISDHVELLILSEDFHPLSLWKRILRILRHYFIIG